MVMVGELAGSPEADAAGCVTAARPKSRTLTLPSVAILTLAGFEIAMDDALIVRDS